jgi:uncharacterized damage-inducible protein DinB
MYTSVEDFKKDFKNENEITLTVFKQIPNQVLDIEPHENIRSIKQLIWHITLTHGEMLGKAGLTINCPEEHSEPLNSIEDIIKTYETASKSVIEQVHKNWKNQHLIDELNMYGETWTKGYILQVLINHEIHHRGQLSTIMRLLNISVPSIYGPTKEDWAKYNMPAAK